MRSRIGLRYAPGSQRPASPTSRCRWDRANLQGLSDDEPDRVGRHAVDWDVIAVCQNRDDAVLSWGEARHHPLPGASTDVHHALHPSGNCGVNRVLPALATTRPRGPAAQAASQSPVHTPRTRRVLQGRARN